MLVNATTGSLTAKLADSSNRAAVFARVQIISNCGRLVGPVVAGYLAENDPDCAPWLLTGCVSVIAAAFFAMVKEQAPDSPAPAKRLPRSSSDLSVMDVEEDLEEEEGSPADYVELGEHVGRLLKERHYPWVSRKDAVHQMLDTMLPELKTKDQEHLLDLEKPSQKSQALPGSR
eukprot:gnl/TRDRNA2_/TRDRNA2_137752_c1_seq1.p1 gnl/TRDRNA2_/TRDRNA2_137752_c1~~gnl/TRDRNA2_/TRDRNA2_137752_c1_seq1.p1  ORF type:complete len:183 (+),score=32.90 gnl/TRDRNA2_/TRDRNA2_137752_c1_seq1:30-551(+)